MKDFLTRTLLGLCMFFLCFNAGFSPSGKSDKQGCINFYGQITIKNSPEKIENILISGNYENIKFFGIPTKEDRSPLTDVTLIRLDDINALSSKPGENIKKFAGREYVEISVAFKGFFRKVMTYLVERARKITYEIPLGTTASGLMLEPLKREVSIEDLQELVISGYKECPRTPQQARQKPMERSAAREALCEQAKKNLEKLEKEANGPFRDFIAQIKEAIYYLCS